MSATKNLKERRKYPRYYPDQKNQPKVLFFLENGQQFSVDVVNISRGGMLASTPDMDYFLEMNHQKIKIIEIIPPNRKPFRCAGKILRIHPILEARACYCAVEFRKIDAKLAQSTIPPKAPKSRATQEKEKKQWESNIWNRVLEAENYFRTPQAADLQQRVYESFADITDHLSLEDRWWFFELLDEIKRQQPGVPEELKSDFLSLCDLAYQKIRENKKSGKMKVIHRKDE
ncbi:MAG: PilZ domain-containing protein [Calditrichaeota bacterium]|nr:PilZ domain-containing protein [Calditrichota bacterium]